MSALDLSSLPPAELNNNQKYPVISSASPVICLMLATSGTVCLCQDQKSHSSHVMSAYINPPLSPCWLAAEGRHVFVLLQPSSSPWHVSCHLEVPWLKGQGGTSPGRQLRGSWTLLRTEWSRTLGQGKEQEMQQGGPQATEGFTLLHVIIPL